MNSNKIEIRGDWLILHNDRVRLSMIERYSIESSSFEDNPIYLRIFLTGNCNAFGLGGNEESVLEWVKLLDDHFFANLTTISLGGNGDPGEITYLDKP